MIRCPYDGGACPDDLCHAGTCVQTGTPPEEYCDICKTWFISDFEECECWSVERDDFYDDDEDDDDN